MKRISLALLGILLTCGLWAQQLDPAKWSYSVKETSATEAELVFTAKIDDGWHIYSQYTDPAGPLPIVFEFAKSADYELVGKVREPKPHEERDPLFDCVVKSFSGTVVFRQTVKRLSDKEITVKGVLSYQMCNNGSCIAPEDRDFSFKVPGAEKTPVVEPLLVAQAVESLALDDTVVEEVAEAADRGDEVVHMPKPEEKKGQNLLVIFLLAIGGGILTMFTPCVFPMIPMTVNFFMHNSDDKRKNRRQAWMFGFSIVFLFAVLGAILALIFGPEALYFIGTHWIPNLLFFIIF
ncbi:MAG: hypothetical protein IK058_00755, partial [Bacteroidales bacterium]|nr:hypothetical protein [Bacteroidales bacterium]